MKCLNNIFLIYQEKLNDHDKTLIDMQDKNDALQVLIFFISYFQILYHTLNVQ